MAEEEKSNSGYQVNAEDQTKISSKSVENAYSLNNFMDGNSATTFSNILNSDNVPEINNNQPSNSEYQFNVLKQTNFLSESEERNIFMKGNLAAISENHLIPNEPQINNNQPSNSGCQFNVSDQIKISSESGESAYSLNNFREGNSSTISSNTLHPDKTPEINNNRTSNSECQFNVLNQATFSSENEERNVFNKGILAATSENHLNIPNAPQINNNQPSNSGCQFNVSNQFKVSSESGESPYSLNNYMEENSATISSNTLNPAKAPEIINNQPSNSECQFNVLNQTTFSSESEKKNIFMKGNLVAVSENHLNIPNAPQINSNQPSNSGCQFNVSNQIKVSSESDESPSSLNIFIEGNTATDSSNYLNPLNAPKINRNVWSENDKSKQCSNVDIFGYSLTSKKHLSKLTVICPSCNRKVGATRFAFHLDRCLGQDSCKRRKYTK